MTNRERLNVLKKGFWVNKHNEITPISEIDSRWLLFLLKKLELYRTGNSQKTQDEGEMYLIILEECKKRKLVFDGPAKNHSCHCGKTGFYTVRVMLKGRLERRLFCKEHRSEAVALQAAVTARRDVGKTLREEYGKKFDSEQGNLSSLRKTSKFGKDGKRRR